MQNVLNALFNLILVSIPEEIFLVVMTLIIIKRFGMLDVRMWRQNLKWIMIPAIPMAMMINLFKYFIIIPMFSTIICLITFYILIVLIVNKADGCSFNKKDCKEIALAMFASFIIWGVLEGVTWPILAMMLNMPIDNIKNNISQNFLISLPSRVIGFGSILYILNKKNSSIKIKIFDVIIKNRFLYTTILTFCISTILLTVYTIKLISYNNILINLPLIEQIFICIAILILPVVVLIWMLMLINYIIVKEKQIQQTYENLVMQDDIMLDVEDL